MPGGVEPAPGRGLDATLPTSLKWRAFRWVWLFGECGFSVGAVQKMTNCGCHFLRGILEHVMSGVGDDV